MSAANNQKLCQLLVRENVIALAQLNAAMQAQEQQGGRLSSKLISLGLITEKQLAQVLAKEYKAPFHNLSEMEISAETVRLFPREKAEQFLVLPILRAANSLTLAMADPGNLDAVDAVRALTNYNNIIVVVSTESDIKSAIEKYYGPGGKSQEKAGTGEEDIGAILLACEADDLALEQDTETENIGDIKQAAEQAPVIRLVNTVLLKAAQTRASDIHIEPSEKGFRVRLRVDGVLYEAMTLPPKLKNAVVSRVKIMSRLDISERRKPQDGRFKMKLPNGQEIDLRVSVLPTLFGEKVVMRLLDKSNLQLDMTKLGFDPGPLAEFKAAIHRPYGMVLVTGPTGSGKTTTLYSALAELNTTTENICTAEDPVEFNIEGIYQVQVLEAIGFTFAEALRAFLRQDPDIIMVGEIRDFETAEISIKAALTGHIVLSTLHTNDAPSTIGRLLNMGIEPFMLTASLNLVVAQRLARRLCSRCKQEIKVDPEALLDLQVPGELIGQFPLFKSVGCKHCNNTGYKGRVALYEVMPVGEDLQAAIQASVSVTELKAEAIRSGMQTLRQAGIKKLVEGITTIEEVLRSSVRD